MLDHVRIDSTGTIEFCTEKSIRWILPYGTGEMTIKGIHKELNMDAKDSSIRLNNLSLLNPEMATLAAVLHWTYSNYHAQFGSLEIVYRGEETILTLDSDFSCIVLTYNRKFFTLSAEHYQALTTRKRNGSILEMKRILLDCAINGLTYEYFEILFNRGVFTA